MRAWVVLGHRGQGRSCTGEHTYPRWVEGLAKGDVLKPCKEGPTSKAPVGTPCATALLSLAGGCIATTLRKPILKKVWPKVGPADAMWGFTIFRGALLGFGLFRGVLQLGDLY